MAEDIDWAKIDAATRSCESGLRRDLAYSVLLEAAKRCQSALAMLTEPGVIRSTSAAGAWATCVAAEAQVRAAIAQAEGR